MASLGRCPPVGSRSCPAAVARVVISCSGRLLGEEVAPRCGHGPPARAGVPIRCSGRAWRGAVARRSPPLSPGSCQLCVGCMLRRSMIGRRRARDARASETMVCGAPSTGCRPDGVHRRPRPASGLAARVCHRCTGRMGDSSPSRRRASRRARVCHRCTRRMGDSRRPGGGRRFGHAPCHRRTRRMGDSRATSLGGHLFVGCMADHRRGPGRARRPIGRMSATVGGVAGGGGGVNPANRMHLVHI